MARVTTPSQRRQQQQQQLLPPPSIGLNGAHPLAPPSLQQSRVATETPLRSGNGGVPPPRLSAKIPSSQRRRRRRRQQGTAVSNNREFQHEADVPLVTVQFVSTAQRSAYNRLPPPSMAAYQRVVDQTATVLGRHHQPRTLQRRLSPSPQHLQVLHALQAQDIIRQVEFAPTVSVEADTTSESPGAHEMMRGRDGRYRPIHVVQASVNSLPSTAPQLSHRKMRLPSRADVGWPGASESEINRKQEEIHNETAWEEATPRLVVLVTSDDLGIVLVEDDVVSDTSDGGGAMKVGGRRISAAHLAWNGGGLPGIPYAGRALLRAAVQNGAQWGRIVPAAVAQAAMLQPTRSLLAPPLEAIHSPSLNWRPRLFHDRAPGRHYAAVAPQLRLTGSASDPLQEQPLLLSLALYKLPGLGENSKVQHPYGKVSEDAWFPAGSGWTERLQLAVLRQEADNQGPASARRLAQAWCEQTLQALLSYDPSQRATLSLVLRVYRVAYVPQDKSGPSPIDPREAVYQQFGFDLLTPVAFGACPLYENLSQSWPEATTVSLPLYPMAGPVSHEDFIDRLTALAHGKIVGGAASSVASVESESVQETPIVNATPSKQRSRVGRLFRTPRLVKTGPKPMDATEVDATPLLSTAEALPLAHVQAHLCIASLGSDFLSVLMTPPKGGGHLNPRLPRLLVDPTGDAAVSLGLEQNATPMAQRLASLPADEGAEAAKRSDLVRLPPLTTPAGYTEAATFREVLPLAPRLERHYPVDSPYSVTSGSLLNFLYLYPRTLRLSSEAALNSSLALTNVTVRVRLMQNDIFLDEDSGKILSRNLALHQLYSPVPWAKDALVDHLYTQLHGDLPGRPPLDLTHGVPFLDEVKLRLPDILDGSYSIEFALFAVDSTSGVGLSLTHLGETTVPLSSTAREGGTGNKVTTVIPNGNHRIKIGNFRLQVETRLVSSIHVSDPSVALALRDFPYTQRGDHVDGRNGPMAPQRVVGGSLSSSHSVDSSVDFNESFPSLLATSSPSVVLAHFRPLMYMHLCNLVNQQDKGRSDSRSTIQFMIGSMLSLFETVRKVKAAFLLDPKRGVEYGPLQVVFKEFVDGFDEGYLSPASSPSNDAIIAPDESPSLHEHPPIDHSTSTDESVSVASHNEESVRMRGRKKLYKKYEDRVAKIVAALGKSSTPFSRVAFGASKTDRMRLEAEIDDENHMFDDDETVMTAFTSPRGGDEPPVHAAPNREPKQLDSSLSDAMKSQLSSNSILHSGSSGIHGGPDQDRISGGAEFARRVRNAAETILAPCVGPSLSNMLASARGKNPSTISKPTISFSEEGSLVASSKEVRLTKPE